MTARPVPDLDHGGHLLGDHPHTDPGDKRTECPVCHKWVLVILHSCKGVDVRTYCPGCLAAPSADRTTTEESHG